MSAPEAKPYIPSLDGMRAIAALLVCTSHLGLPLAGFLGVPVFFVLSGYLITTLALREERARGRLSLRAFYTRRCFRIFPIYFLILALHLIWFLALGHGRAEERAFYADYWTHYVFYFQEFMPMQRLKEISFENLMAQSWSLGIEEKFYLVWPLLCFVALRPWARARPWVTALACAAFAVSFFGPTQRMFFGYHQIFLGCLLALLVQREPPAVVRRPAFLAIAGILLVAVQALAELNENYAIFYAPVFACVMLAVLSGESWLKRLLGSRVMAYLGRISYGIYLTHMFAIEVVDALGLRILFDSPVLNGCVGFVATALVATGLSSALHFTVERPLINLGRRLAARGVPPLPAEAKAEAA